MNRLEGYALSPQQQDALLTIGDGFEGTVAAVFSLDTMPDQAKLQQAVFAVLEQEGVFRLQFADDVQVPGEQHRVTFDQEMGEALLQVISDPTTPKVIFRASALCTDTWGLYVLALNVFATYKGITPFPAAPIDYLQFATWQQGILNDEDAAEGKLYWQSKLSVKNTVAPEVLYAKKHEGQLPVLKQLKISLDKQSGGSESLLAVCWYLVLWQLNNKNNFLFGHIHHGRSFEQLYHLAGNFSKTLPLQLLVNGHLPLSAVLQQYEQELATADLHKETLIMDTHYHTAIAANVPYRFAYNDFNLLGEQLSVSPELLQRPAQQVQLLLDVYKTGEQYNVVLNYDSLAYTASDAEYLLHAWQAVLQQFGANENTPAADISLLDEVYRTRLGKFSRPSGKSLPFDNVVALFRKQVNDHPDKTAVADKHRSLTYTELDKASTLLAGRLVNKGNIGVILEEKVEMIIALLAVLKAGGTYIPIDPNDASRRVQHILADSGVSYVIDHVDITDTDETVTLPERHADTPAYIIYTSGTTGLPKGVVIKDISLVNYICWLQEFAGISEKDSAVLLSSYAFDLGYTALWGTILSGGTLYLLPKEDVQDVEGLGRFIREKEITFLKSTPSFFNVLIQGTQLAHTSLRLAILGGERINTDDLRHLRLQVINHYGPTESTIGTIAYKIPTDGLRDYSQRPVIGVPVTNNFVLILDEKGKPAAPGITGDIFIGGIGLATGYLNREELTAEKFVSYPATGEQIYATGDVGCWLPDGTIMFQGRKDEQVKIRGYRVEPGEVKAAVAAYPGMGQVAVAVKGETYNRELWAYFTAAHTIESNDLRTYLKDTLPDFMLPSQIIQVNEIPLNANGKVDYKKLPEPVAVVLKTAARNNREAAILQVWRQILGNDTLGIDDSFFDNGGHSLKAIQLVNRLKKELQLKANLKDIFDMPTVRAFYDATKNNEAQSFSNIEPLPVQVNYALSHAQQRIWLSSQRQDSRSLFNVPQHCLFHGRINIAALEQAFVQLINRHESLRTLFRQVDGTVVQIVLNPEQVNFSLQQETATGDAINNIVNSEVTTPFDLEREIGLRARLINIGPDEHLLLFTLHHIISDGWSRQIIYKELLHFYESAYWQKPAALSPLRIQYKDYVNWHNKVYPGQEKFWQQFFQGLHSNNFPLDFKRPKELTFGGNIAHRLLTGEDLALLKKTVTANRLTLNSFMLAIYGLLLHEYCDSNEITVATIVSGRSHFDLEPIVGVFINYLPFKINIDPATDLISYINKVNQDLNTLFQYQEYPFDLMVEQFAGEIKPNRNPVFDTMLIFHEEETQAALQALPGDVRVSQYEVEERKYFSKLDFKLDISSGENALALRLEYNSNLFTPQSMELLLDRYVALVHKAAAQPARGLSELHVIPEADRQELAAIRTRQLIQQSELKIIASFTAEPLEEPLNWWLETLEQPADISFGSYHQVFQELMSFKGQTCVLLNRFSDYEGGFDMLTDRLKELVANVAKSVPVIIVRLPSAVPEDVFFDAATVMDNVYVVDLRSYEQLHPGLQLFDEVSYRQAKIPFTEDGFYFIAYHIVRTLWTIKNNPCKVIALDCDNTLWKGVCGEDGVDGILIGEGHRALQQFFLQKHAEGFLLVLLSKNNEEDVWQVFDTHPGMVLKKEHFAGWRINWADKSENIRALANELNLGLDSFAFIDDNPVECLRMMENAPQVLTLELPEDQLHFLPFLQQVIAFDKLKVSKEDRDRNQMYRAEAQRAATRKDSDLLEFLEQLELEISVRPMADTDIDRVTQLCLRTNQFNLNGIRRDKQEIVQLAARAGWHCYVVHVRDRFGDYGLTGAVILEVQPEQLEIHTFVLSCRVLGRGVEQALAKTLKDLAGQKHIEPLFRQTEKNAPFAAFLQNDPWSQSAPFITVYLNRDLPVKELVDPATTVPVSFVFDHLGIAVADVEKSTEQLTHMGFHWGQEVYDPIQQCNLKMGHHPAWYNIEFVWAANDQSPIVNMLADKTFYPYHICFRVKSHAAALTYLGRNSLIKEAQPAVLFNNLKVLFIYLQDVGLVELLEDPGMNEDTVLPSAAIPVIQVVSAHAARTRKVLQLIGFEPAMNMMKNKQHLYIDIASGNAPDGTYNLVWDTRLFDEAKWTANKEYIRFMSVQSDSDQHIWIWRKNLTNESQLFHKQVYKALEYASLDHLRKIKQEESVVMGDDSELEVGLLLLFREILKHKRVGMNDDFFQSGGHSIKAVQLLSRIYSTVGIEVPLARFFELRTVSNLAAYIKEQQLNTAWMQTAIAENDSRFEEIVI